MNYVITEKVICFKDNNFAFCYDYPTTKIFILFYKQHLIKLHIFFSPDVNNNQKVFTTTKIELLIGKSVYLDITKLKRTIEI